MDNFFEWQFADSFTAIQASLLIEGINPSDISSNGYDNFGKQLYSEVIVRRMKSSYEETWENYHFRDIVLEPCDIPLDEKKLPSERMEYLVKKSILLCCQSIFDKWLSDGEEIDFYKQRFTRQALQRWLDENQFLSSFRFETPVFPTSELAATQDDPSMTARWPWGNHHTDMLGHLEAAANRFWVNYDPTDATTAPINKDVAGWLVNERKVSKKMAESIASMLRPDDLATGPRK